MGYYGTMTTSTTPENTAPEETTLEYGFALKNRPKSSTTITALPDVLTGERWFTTPEAAQKAAHRSSTNLQPTVLIRRTVTQPLILRSPLKY